ncbi:16S rRNA (cytidine(1402)-2'-O)-methyltransferase [Patescibacteria group bacterium]
MGTLYVVATPIGNLEDVTLRAIRILKEADLIAAEDTRTTRKLTSRFDISTPIVAYFQHSGPIEVKKIIDELKAGKKIALVSEAGTPAISDPGTVLVAEAVKHGIKVEPIPGASAVAAAASISGLPVDRFAFYGFLPHKKGRQKMIKQMLAEDKTVIFYESPHRIVKTLQQITDTKSGEVEVVLGRELTKKFEEILRGRIEDILEDLKERENIKGEFVALLKCHPSPATQVQDDK